MRRRCIPCLFLLAGAWTHAQTTSLTVTDRSGGPVSGANVEILADESVVASSTTNEEGIGSVTLDVGIYRARVTGRGHVVGLSESFEQSAESKTALTITLFPGSVLAGTMLDADGGRVGGGELCLSLHDARSFPPSAFGEGLLAEGEQCWEADENGQLATPVLPLGRYDLSIRAQGKVPRHSTVELEADHPAQTWQLHRGGAVQGRVQDQEELPVAGADVKLRHRELELEQDGRTDAEGRFAIGGLAAGPWNVRVEPADAAVLSRDGIVVETGVTVDLGMLRVRPGLSIDGTVVDADGRPVEGAELQVRRSDRTGRAIRTVKSDGKGNFLAAGLGESEVHLLIDAPEGNASNVIENVEPPQRGLEIELAASGRVCGSVTTDEGGVARGASVEARPVLEGVLNDYGSLTRASTSAIDPGSGAFCIEDVYPEEKVVVSARAAGYKPARAAVRVLPGEESEPVDLVLERGLTLEGIVVSRDGQPVSDAAVRGRNTSMVFTDRFGEFRLTGLHEGMTTVVAEHPSHAASERDIMLPLGVDQEFRIELGPGGVIEGSVTRRGGEPVEGVPILLSDPEREQLTDADGAFRFETVPAGDRSITRKARGRYDDFEVRRVEIVEDEVTRVEFTLGVVLEGQVLRGGVPVPDVGITLAQPRDVVEYSGGDRAVQRTFSDETGAYRLSGVRAGWGTVTLEDGRQTIVRQIEVPQGDAPRRDIPLPDRPIRGSVVNALDGTGLANASVTVDLAQTAGAPESSGSSSYSSRDESGGVRYNLTSQADSRTLTDAAGNFIAYTDALPEVNVGAWADGFRWTSVTAYPDRAEPVRIELSRETKLLVKLRDARGNPASGANVCAVEMRDEGRSTSCSSGGNDRVVFSLNEGRYKIMASASGFGTQVFERDMKPTADGSATTVTVDLIPGAVLEIRLVGQASDSAQVVSLLDPNGTERIDLVESEAVDPATGDRRWRTWGLNPGVWSLTVDDGSGELLRRDVDVVPGPPIEVTLP